MLDFADLKSALKRYGFDDNDPLSVWINAGLQEFMQEEDFPFLRKLIGINVDAYSGTFNPFFELPDDYRKMKSVYDHTDNVLLDFFSTQEYARTPEQQGTPNNYTIYDELSPVRAYLWPFSPTDIQLEITYHINVAKLVADDDVPNIPSAYHYTIVYAAARIALMAENEEDRAATAATEFQKGVARAMKHSNDPQSGTLLQISDTQGYFDC